jgi:hypothetical protein
MKEIELGVLINASNERRWLSRDHLEHIRHRCGQNLRHRRAAEIATTHHKCSNTCVDQGLTFDGTTTNALVLRHDYPLTLSYKWQPIDIFGSTAKMRVMLFDDCATTLRNRIRDLLTWQICICEEGQVWRSEVNFQAAISAGR